MENYLSPKMDGELREMPSKGLAYIGDCVYELMVRTYLCQKDIRASGKLHDKAISFVSAKAQAAASAMLLEKLSDEEKEIYKRGRNTHTGTVPRNSAGGEYQEATGLEALFGYLYLRGDTARLNELFGYVIAGERPNAT